MPLVTRAARAVTALATGLALSFRVMLRRKVTDALQYPAFILVAAGCVLMFFILFGGAFPVTMVVFKYLERAFARTPEECWTSDGDPVVYEDREALDPDPEWL